MAFGLIRSRRAIVLLPASRRGGWTRFAPGIQLIEEATRWFEAHEAVEFDLSVGDHPYKQRLAADENALIDAVFAAASPAGSIRPSGG